MTKYSFLQPFKVDKIRVGDQGDGAYILEKNSLKKIDVVLSYGCGWDTSFEKSFSKERNVPIYIFDPTLIDKSMLLLYKEKFGSIIGFARYCAKLISFITQLLIHKLAGRKLHFVNEGIALVNSEKYKTMKYHYRKYNLIRKNVLLKIDVEGAEYEFWLTDEFKNLLQNVVQLSIEIHDLKLNYKKVKEFYKMMETQFIPIHIHGNNYAGTYKDEGMDVPNVIEVTWVRKELIMNKEKDSRLFPSLEFDTPNNLTLPDIDLSPLWTN